MPTRRFRDDERCGTGVEKLPDGSPVECDPLAPEAYCCSDNGWCGDSLRHCHCRGCVNYNLAYAAKRAFPLPPLFRAPMAGAPRGGATSVVIIPFRDRETHLRMFKEFWRWFAKEGAVDGQRRVSRWEIFVVEQFDALTFNRGWNFNVGLAIASAQTMASPDITADMGLDFDCAVIQDIDYLPEKGVDYAKCDVPIQLSAEIDRYNWKTPYLISAGGIVSASLHHWRTINGFSNEYYGWGGEDDELHHRFRLNDLLYGDCYPYCTDNDTTRGKAGISIKRPPKGHGRFSGKYMHSANHTKRITVNSDYERNLQLLREIHMGAERWRGDGLKNLAFRIVTRDVDTTDTLELGITYHRVCVHRGLSHFDVRDVLLAVPMSICDPGSEASGWSVTKLRDDFGFPWDLASLQSRVAASARCASDTDFSFILVDRRWHLAKVLTAEEPEMLLTFYRSLASPADDGLIIADARPADEIREAFELMGAVLVPPTKHSVCASFLEQNGPKFSIHPTPTCSGAGWKAIKHGYFRAYVRPRKGMVPVSYCEGPKYWTQRVVQGLACGGNWSGMEWLKARTFWSPPGEEFCFGTRQMPEDADEGSFSRVIPRKYCGGNGFNHDGNFASVGDMHKPAALTLCILRAATPSQGGVTRIAMAPHCKHHKMKLAARFPVRTQEHAQPHDMVLCVYHGEHGDSIRLAGQCESDRAPGTLDFVVASSGGHGAGRFRVCVLSHEGGAIGLGAECDHGAELAFDVPSPAEVAASGAASLDSDTGSPLFSLIDEETPCFGFLCEGALKNAMEG